MTEHDRAAFATSLRSGAAARSRHRLGAIGMVGAGLLLATSARAASLQEVEQNVWWQDVAGLPSYVNMYLYVPDQLADSPPIVVAPHHCQGNGPGTFSEMSSLVTLADQNGFIMIFPEATGQNCWDAGSDRSLQHDGKGDTHAIAQMVRYILSIHGANANRVYSVGGSSGGIMTEALLGVYPDLFMAGVSLMGVPCGCWAEDYNDVVGNPSDGTGQWSGACAGGNVVKTGQEWGDLVRSSFAGYSGHRPRLQHWHGTEDTVLSYANMAEDIKQWTNVLELTESPTGSDAPANGTTRQFWTNACGYTVYEAFSLSGVGHSVPFDGNAVAEYFGLDDAAGPDPEAAACPGTGGTNTSSSTGVAGATASGAGGVGASSTGDTGASQTQAASSTGSPSSTAGSSSSSGAVSVSATSGSATTSNATGASIGTASTSGTGGMSSGTPGQSVDGDAGNTGANSTDEGCACGVVGHARPFGPGTLGLLAAASLMLRLRRRPASRGQEPSVGST